MWPQMNASTRSSQSSFNISIKIDALEAQRRLQRQFEAGFRAPRKLSGLLLPIDPDKTFWDALVALKADVAAAHDDLLRVYVPERAYLATGVLTVEALFPRIRALLGELKVGGQDRDVQEGWVLRATSLVLEIEHVQEELEEMRTALGKELLGSKVQLGEKNRRRFWRLTSTKAKELAEAKKLEAACPCHMVPAPKKQRVDQRFYL